MENILDAISNISTMFDEVVAQYGDAEQPGSIRARDMTSFSDKARKVRVAEAFSMGAINLRLALDNINALPGIVRANAPFLVVVAARAILEESSLSMWFYDPSIDSTERIRRNLMQLCQVKEEVKKLHLMNNDVAEAAKIEDFFDNRLLPILTACGVEFKNAKGKATQPQNLKPDISTMSEKNYDSHARAAYKIFSGIAYGQTNTIVTFAYDFGNAQKKDAVNLIEYKPKIEIIYYALKFALLAFEKAVRTVFQTNGWDFGKIETAFGEFSAAFNEVVRA